MILGEVEYTAWRTGDGAWANEGDAGAEPVRVAEADTAKGDGGGGLVLRDAPHARVSARAHKMSKSRGNVVNPDDVVWEFGADR
jgi:leucyl-tRNA synthetase